jgi:hypothetical protein
VLSLRHRLRRLPCRFRPHRPRLLHRPGLPSPAYITLGPQPRLRPPPGGRGLSFAGQQRDWPTIRSYEAP